METNKKYIVVQIGCIGCGISSYPVGVYYNIRRSKQSIRKTP